MCAAMLHDSRFQATLPVTDMQRARAFYEEKLGFPPGVEDAAGVF